LTDRTFDLAVVGAGTAGCAAALEAARSGLRVILLDRRDASQVGTKACGDAMEENEILWTREVLGVDLAPAILRSNLGARISTSDGKDHLVIPPTITARAVVDRPRMGRLILEAAIAAGARFHGGAKVLGWICEDGAVVGVRTDFGDVRARCCLDCSGASSGLRQKVAASGPLERETGAGRLAFAYRELAEVPGGLPHPDEIVLTYDLAASNGGYVWYFPNGPKHMNVGIGGAPAPRPWAKLLEDHGRSWGIRWDRRSSAGAFLPARTFLSCAVAPGYIACGDAACCVGPLDGAGIHSSLLTGHLAALQAVRALAQGEATIERLWGYHRAYLRYRWRDSIVDHGAGISAQEALRPLLQSLGQEDFDALVRMADSRTVTALYSTSWRSVGPLLKVVGKLVSRPGLVAKIIPALWWMTLLRTHLLAYPDTSDRHPAWNRKLNLILSRAAVINPETP
jgi:digeranylgeranylglycerophospholipid reductase